MPTNSYDEKKRANKFLVLADASVRLTSARKLRILTVDIFEWTTIAGTRIYTRRRPSFRNRDHKRGLHPTNFDEGCIQYPSFAAFKMVQLLCWWPSIESNSRIPTDSSNSNKSTRICTQIRRFEGAGFWHKCTFLLPVVI